MEFPYGATYMIIPRCGKSASLVLGQLAVRVKGDPIGHLPGPVQLMKADENDPQCLWGIQDNTNDGRLRLLNDVFVYGRAALTAPYRNGPVEMVHRCALHPPTIPEDKAPPAHHWVVKPQGDSEWCALHVAENPRQSLNVAGNGPYAPGNLIYAYDWSGGAPNELWLFLRVS